MASRDYYEVLGVDKNASKKEIKRAFLNLARKLHPDVSDDPDAEEKFKEVNEAYSVLYDDQKRQNYDQFGDPNGFGGSSFDMGDMFSGFGSVEDIFSTIFGGGSASGRARTSQPRTAGRDMSIRLRISLEDAAAGVTRTISFDRDAPCDQCAGTGSKTHAQATVCPECHGSGSTVEVHRVAFGAMQTEVPCKTCGGTGRVISDPCDHCHGQGRMRKTETVEVKIPAGVRSGQRLTINNMGEAGLYGDKSGDLLVTVEILPHERFERRGDMLYTVIDVDALHAIVGQTITIDGILDNEKVKVKVPAGTQHGDEVHVKGRGMLEWGRGIRADLVAVINVVTNTDFDKKELKALTDLVKKHDAKVTKHES